MANSQSPRLAFAIGLTPQRCFSVTRRLLTGLVVCVALFQVIPAGLTTSQARMADAVTDSSVAESLSAGTHVAESWMTQRTSTSPIAIAKPSDLPHVGWIASDEALAIGNRLPRYLQRCSVSSDSRWDVTLVDLYVRLQI